MICIKCGEEIDDGTHFCKYCGEAVEKTESIEEQPSIESETKIETMEESSSNVESLETEEGEENSSNDAMSISAPSDMSLDSSTPEPETSTSIDFSAPSSMEEHQELNTMQDVNFMMEEKSPESEEKPKKSKAWIGIVVVVLLLLAGAGIVLFFPHLLLNEKKVVEKEVKTMFSSFKKALTETSDNVLKYDLNKESLGVSGNFTIHSNYKDSAVDLTKLKNYHLNYQGIIDKQANQASAQLKLSKNTSDVIAINGFVDGDELLVSLGDLYSKLLSSSLGMEIKDIDFPTSQNTDDINKLIDITERIVKDSIDKKDIEKKSVSKKINGKEEKLTRVDHHIDTTKLEKNLIQGYLKDKEALKIISKMINVEEEDIKSVLENELEYFDDLEGSIITVSFYLKGLGTVREIEITEKDSEGDAIIVDVDGNDYYYQIKSDNQVVAKGEYKSKTKTFTLTIGNEIFVTLKEKNKNTDILDIEFKTPGFEAKINAEISNKVTATSQEISMTMKMNYDSVEVTQEMNMTLEKNKKVEELKKTNTISMDKMTEADEEKIMQRLETKITNIIKEIAPGLGDEVSFRKVMEQYS